MIMTVKKASTRQVPINVMESFINYVSHHMIKQVTQRISCLNVAQKYIGDNFLFRHL